MSILDSASAFDIKLQRTDFSLILLSKYAEGLHWSKFPDPGPSIVKKIRLNLTFSLHDVSIYILNNIFIQQFLA